MQSQGKTISADWVRDLKRFKDKDALKELIKKEEGLAKKL